MGPHADHITRLGDILIGRHYPTTDELLRLMPFWCGELHRDLLLYARKMIGRLEALDPARETPEHRLLLAARALREAAHDGVDGDITAKELSRVVQRLLNALPEDDQDGRLRCMIYRAALGDRTSQIVIAAEAASVLAMIADKAKAWPSHRDVALAWAVMGWMAAFASSAVHEPISGARRPQSMRNPADTALAQGRTITEWLRGEPSPGADPADTIKRDLLQRAGGYLEADLAAGWLGMTVEELRQHAEVGDLIAAEWDGRLLVPAFQLRNSMTLLRVREILAEMPIKSAWMRLEWLVTPDDALGGQTPLEAFQRGREAEVRELARSHGAD